MISLRPTPTFDRRQWLAAGAASLGGLSLDGLLRARAANSSSQRETSVIVLYMHGGPSHLETYDLKPDAPTSYRSVFSPIATRVSGMEICELFPRQAELAEHLAIVRSVHHEMSSHSDGGIEVLTGKTPQRPDPTSTSKSDHPDCGHILSKFRGPGPGGLPAYVAVPQRPYMTRPNYLGIEHHALETGDPSIENYRPPVLGVAGGADPRALDNRAAILAQLDRMRRDAEYDGELRGHDAFRAQALEILTSTTTAQAFDLTSEPQDLRERYGFNRWGQSFLLARRLVEAGAGLVNVYVDTPASGDDYTNWDDHILNAGRPGHFAHYMQVRLPYLDQALSALIGDLVARDLDRQVLIVAMGEFGRTPRLSSSADGVGRDHWPQAQSVLFACGGLRLGQVVGATNARGEYPAERPYTPQDVLATVYRHLGLDWRAPLVDHTGRPVPLVSDGEPIAELF